MIKRIFVLRSWATGANGLTFLRLISTVPIILMTVKENYLVSGILMAAAGASDIADGTLARRTGTASNLGAILDVIADAALVLTLQFLFAVSGGWPVYLPVLSILSLLTFVLIPHKARIHLKCSIGKYTGAVLMCGIILYLAGGIISRYFQHAAMKALSPVLAVYLLSVIIDNLFRSVRFLKERNDE